MHEQVEHFWVYVARNFESNRRAKNFNPTMGGPSDLVIAVLCAGCNARKAPFQRELDKVVEAEYLPGCAILDHLAAGEVVVPVFGSPLRFQLLKLLRAASRNNDSAIWRVRDLDSGVVRLETLLGRDVRYRPRTER